MRIFKAICIDKHCDEDVEVFTTPKAAMEYCKQSVPPGYGLEEQELNSSMISAGWIYYATYGGENSVRVEQGTLNTKKRP